MERDNRVPVGTTQHLHGGTKAVYFARSVSHFLFAHFCAGCSDCSWAAPGGGVTPCTGNSSLGTAGRPGDWYSFVPAAPNMHHEVRLLLDGATAEGAAFSISPDIFDGSGDRAPTSTPPTLHSRPDGAMLRWNTTSGTGPFFVRAAASVRYSMAVAMPTGYTVEMLGPTAELNGSIGPTRSIRPMPADNNNQFDWQPVDLQFDFVFDGLSYSRVWVSGAGGFVSFEAPSAADAGGPLHSAVVACGGAFDVAHSGAAVTVMAGPDQLQVRWNAPLFRSRRLSDVTIGLSSDGALIVNWTKVELHGGSLQHGLVAWLADMSFAPNQTIADASGNRMHGTILTRPDGVAQPTWMDFTRYFSPAAEVVRYPPNSTHGSLLNRTQTDQRLYWHDDGAAQTAFWMQQQCEDRGERLCTYAEICPGSGPEPAALAHVDGRQPIIGDEIASLIASGRNLWVPAMEADGTQREVSLGPFADTFFSTCKSCSRCCSR